MTTDQATADLMSKTAEGINKTMEAAKENPATPFDATPSPIEADIGDSMADVGAGDPEIVKRSVAAAAELVKQCRALNAEGFRRLNNMIRVSANARLIDAEYVIMRHHFFGRSKAADKMSGFRDFYQTMLKVTALFMEATMDEAGLNRLGVAFGGLEVGAMTLPAMYIANAVNKAIAFIGRSRGDLTMAGAMAGADDLRGAILMLESFLTDAGAMPAVDAGAVAPAMADAAPVVKPTPKEKPAEESSQYSADHTSMLAALLSIVPATSDRQSMTPFVAAAEAVAEFSRMKRMNDAYAEATKKLSENSGALTAALRGLPFDANSLVTMLATIRREATALKLAVFGGEGDVTFARDYPALAAFVEGAKPGDLDKSLGKLADATTSLEAKLNEHE